MIFKKKRGIWCGPRAVPVLLANIEKAIRKLPKDNTSDLTITGDHSKYDQMLFGKIGEYVGFSIHRRSYLIWPPVISLSLNSTPPPTRVIFVSKKNEATRKLPKPLLL